MAQNKTANPFFFLNPVDRQRVIHLFDEIRADVQYLILIVAKHPNAEVVKEVRSILAALSYGNNLTEGKQ
jgi:hypothetical protein